MFVNKFNFFKEKFTIKPRTYKKMIYQSKNCLPNFERMV